MPAPGTLPDIAGRPQLPKTDINPTTAGSIPELAACLSRLRAQAEISYRGLEQWGSRHGTPMPRSTMADVFAGRRLPRKQVLLTYLRACGIDPRTDPRWLAAWTRLAEQRTAPRPASEPIGQQAATQESAQRILDEALAIRAAAERDAAELRAAAREDIAWLRAKADVEPDHRRDLDAKLAADIAGAGLLRVGTNYLNELEWEQLFAGVRQLDIFVAYGQTWRNLHARHLHDLAARPGSKIRVFLPDPADDTTIATLADRFAITVEEMRRRIEATRADYELLRRPDGADVEILYRPGDRLYSFYRLDDTAVLGLYSHSRNRMPSIPVLVCRAPGSLYQFIMDDLCNIEQQSRRV
ncbi:hypothetical protein EDC02_5096 [Micromonospora sp. Llam0]|uniref:helix-turn-helix domain-containing protein n=1 Tax=Micromonospora sp. Llam0 TaxID=2485143 RepID=UPI000FB73085|nr:helix-turn-helix domain-containing protein [Micromonospora sp. Llam0]ROO63083.1 hypothetical protein EDC02_5096 [Micromonospora sp. Llam0]